MTDVTNAIEQFEQVTKLRGGLRRLAEAADVPYTTVADWKAKGWRPQGVKVFEKLVAAAERLVAEGDAEHADDSEAAA